MPHDYLALHAPAHSSDRHTKAAVSSVERKHLQVTNDFITNSNGARLSIARDLVLCDDLF